MKSTELGKKAFGGRHARMYACVDSAGVLAISWNYNFNTYAKKMKTRKGEGVSAIFPINLSCFILIYISIVCITYRYRAFRMNNVYNIIIHTKCPKHIPTHTNRHFMLHFDIYPSFLTFAYTSLQRALFSHKVNAYTSKVQFCALHSMGDS